MNKMILNWKWMLRQIACDPMMLAACCAPFLLGGLMKWGIPAAMDRSAFVSGLIRGYPYEKITDLFLSQITPLMLFMAASMVMLEEKDDRTQQYFFITPLGRRGYFFSRFSLAALLSFFITFVVLSLFSLAMQGFTGLVMISFLGMIPSALILFLVLHFAENRLAGMAILKVSAVTLMGLFIPFFMESSGQYLFSVLPAYWIAKGLAAGNYALCFVSIPSLFFWVAAIRILSTGKHVKIVE